MGSHHSEAKSKVRYSDREPIDAVSYADPSKYC